MQQGIMLQDKGWIFQEMQPVMLVFFPYHLGTHSFTCPDVVLLPANSQHLHLLVARLLSGCHNSSHALSSRSAWEFSLHTLRAQSLLGMVGYKQDPASSLLIRTVLRCDQCYSKQPICHLFLTIQGKMSLCQNINLHTAFFTTKQFSERNVS